MLGKNKKNKRVDEHAQVLAALELAARNDAEWRAKTAKVATCVRKYQCEGCSAGHCSMRRG